MPYLLKLRHRLPQILVWALLVFSFGLFQYRLEPSTHAAGTFVVTSVEDSGPGSFRQAIIDANNNPGLDIISFNISGSVRSIKPILTLPTITDPVVIDGTTQPGFSGTPLVELNGAAGAATIGLNINASGCTIRALIINGFHLNGIFISNSSSGCHVEGCYIGTDSTGTVAMPNFGAGISVQGSNNVIGGTSASKRNVISGNSGAGIAVELFCCTGTIPVASGNLIQGNFIGVNAVGSSALPNQREGVVLTTAAPDADVHGNKIGGTEPGAGNVISGNRFDGIVLGSFQTTSNVVQGNFIGTDATGSLSIPNSGDGIRIDVSRNNVIGGSEPGARNVISGNGSAGSGSSGGNGVSVGGSAGSGATGNIILGNLVGVNATGNAPLPNLFHGIAVVASGNTIGGPNVGDGNVVAFSGYDGVVVAGPATGNSIRGNSIFSNGRLNHPSGVTIGIDLGNNGVTPNDAGDSDTGPNGLQNFPKITSATVGPTSVNVKGTIESTANTNLNLDFYANSVCDSTGYGEGARLIGSGPVTTNASGNATFDLTFTVVVTPNEVFSATATDPAGNTSEFSQCSASSPAIGSVGFTTTSLNVNEGVGSTSFIVNRTGGSAGSLTVNYSLIGLTATAGEDFASTQGTLTFADGETSKSFNAVILNDNIDEPVETAIVTLSTSGNLDTLSSQSTMTLSIIDDDPTPTLAISDVSAAEGNSGTTNLVFSLTLSRPSSRAVTINFTTTDGSAIGGGNDYVSPATNSISILAGQLNATITIAVVSDTFVEPDESFFVELAAASNAVIVDRQGKGTIVNDDGDSTPLLLELVFEESSNNSEAAAVDSMLFMRSPFPVINDANFLLRGTDRNTRVMVFARNLQLTPGQPVVVKLIDNNGQGSAVTAEDVRPVNGSDLEQIIFRLPDNLVPGSYTISVQANNTVSNSASLTIRY